MTRERITLPLLSLMFALSSLFVMFISPPISVSAAVEDGCSSSFLGLPQWFKYLDVKKVGTDQICQVVGPCVDIETGQPSSDCVAGSTRLDIPVVTQRVAIAILDMLLRVAGIVAFGFIIFAGFRFVMSEGDANKAKAARETAMNAAIGLGIAMVATGIVAFIGRSISN